MKKKMWIASLIAALSISAVAGGVAVAKQQAVVTDAAETWSVGEIASEYVYGDSFTVPAATVEVNGEQIAAEATVTYPDGTVVNTDSVKLNQAGRYVVSYRAVSSTGVNCIEEKTFEVGMKAYISQDAKTSISYGKYTEYGANSEGLLVRLAAKDSIDFTRLIDVDELRNDNSIIDFFITPDTRGVYDFNDVVVRLTDALDDSIYVEYRVQRWRMMTSGLGYAFVSVGGNGQSQVGFESGKGYHVDKEGYGTPIQFTFMAVQNAGGWSGASVDWEPDASIMSLSLDPDKLEAKAKGKYVAELDNYDCYETLWTGFPSGKVRLSVSADNYSADTANFCITKVLGVDITDNSFTESEAPMISVSTEQENMPKGQVGYAYKIPTASAVDFYSGDCSVTTNVYRDYISENPISVSVKDGKIMPTTYGWYTIEYKAKDLLGNEATELRNVYITKDLGDISVTLPENRIESAELGTPVPVEMATYTGDCGVASVEITATNGDDVIEVTDSFLPTKAGDWTVKYTVTDYIGRVGTAEYTVTASVGAQPIVLIEKPALQSIYMMGGSYVLPKAYATDYSSGVAVTKLCKVIVKDANGEKTYNSGDTFSPNVENHGDKVVITYQCEGVNVYSEEISCANVLGASGKFVAVNYFDCDGLTAVTKDQEGTAYREGIGFVVNEGCTRGEFTFVNTQLASDFSIVFEGVKDLANFETLVITLTDSLNSAEKIALRMKVRATSTAISTGGEEVTVTQSLVTDKKYKIYYDDGKFKFDGVSLAAEKTVDGEDFNGFSSNLVYVTVAMEDATPGARVKLTALCESSITNRGTDVFKPNFKVLGDFGGEQSLNTVYEIYPAMANDVFAPNVSLTLTVIAPDGTVVVDNNGLPLQNVPTDVSYFITLSQYGKYTATYSIVEENWIASNKLDLSMFVFVIDESAPQLKFTNATQTTAKVGDTITLPDFALRDNLTATEDLIVVRGVVNPWGRLYLFGDGENAIKCSYAGDYVFMVMVTDERGNSALITHTITVSVD